MVRLPLLGMVQPPSTSTVNLTFQVPARTNLPLPVVLKLPKLDRGVDHVDDIQVVDTDYLEIRLDAVCAGAERDEGLLLPGNYGPVTREKQSVSTDHGMELKANTYQLPPLAMLRTMT